MENTLTARLFSACRRFAVVAALSLAVATLAACETSAEPTPEGPTATAIPTTPEATVNEASQTNSATTEEAAPSAKLAPTFELPNAKGETINLASYAGDKNVVLVFYRGFW